MSKYYIHVEATAYTGGHGDNGSRCQKSAVYAAHVQTLMKMNGADGARNWRHELAELLSKWHPIFQGVVKARKGQRLPEHDVQDMDSQVVDASFL